MSFQMAFAMVAAVLETIFGVVDVPSPSNQEEMAAFAAAAMIDGSASDENAVAWSSVGAGDRRGGIEGMWSSRWNGGVDSTILADAKDKWKRGRAEVRTAGGRVYLLFDGIKVLAVALLKQSTRTQGGSSASPSI
jgi:hypothetical protein